MNDDPRLILAARRASGLDDADPAIADALARTQHDAALREWARNEQQLDAAVAQKLRQVQPPAGLREAILAGAKVSSPGWWSWFDRRAWRNVRNGELIAIAAVVLIFAVALVSRFFVPSHSTWQLAAAAEIARIESAEAAIEHAVGDLREIETWLAAQTCPSPTNLPTPLRALRIYGCSKRNWRGEPMSILCFDLGGGKEVHLVTISRMNLAVEPPAGAPEYAEISGFQTASWSEGEVAMMLIGKVTREDLEKLLKPALAVRFPTAQAGHET